jgi:hypothetical protein
MPDPHRYPDKQVQDVDKDYAKYRWANNLPVSLKQLAVANEMPYNFALDIAKLSGFPMLSHLVWPIDFHVWRQQKLGLLTSLEPIEQPTEPLKTMPILGHCEKCGEEVSLFDVAHECPPVIPDGEPQRSIALAEKTRKMMENDNDVSR